MPSISEFTKEIISSGVAILILLTLRVVLGKFVRNYAKTNEYLEHRTNLVVKYIQILLNILAFIALIVIWGVQTKDIFITVSSIATVVGVAMFAQWSILSNITSGMILFFSNPFKIGNTIRIHDKDYPIEAEIIDITAFHFNLKTKDGEKIVYPNNLLFQKGISIVETHYENHEFFD